MIDTAKALSVAHNLRHDEIAAHCFVSFIVFVGGGGGRGGTSMSSIMATAS